MLIDRHNRISTPDDDGWTKVTDIWTYASATTITVPSGATSKYQVGDKLKLTQTTVKYFYIVAVADTTLTIIGGSDYTFANAAVSNIFYSHSLNSISFPDWFNFTPSRAVSGGTVPTYTTTDISRFCLKGNTCYVVCHWVNASGGTPGSSASQAVTFQLPVSISTNISNAKNLNIGFGFYSNSSTYSIIVGQQITDQKTMRFQNYNGGLIYGDSQNNAARSIVWNAFYEI